MLRDWHITKGRCDYSALRRGRQGGEVKRQSEEMKWDDI